MSKRSGSKRDKATSANKNLSNADWLKKIGDLLKDAAEGRVLTQHATTAKEAKEYLNGCWPTLQTSKSQQPTKLFEVLHAIEKKNLKRTNEKVKANISEAETELKMIQEMLQNKDRNQQTSAPQEDNQSQPDTVPAPSDWSGGDESSKETQNTPVDSQNRPTESTMNHSKPNNRQGQPSVQTPHDKRVDGAQVQTPHDGPSAQTPRDGPPPQTPLVAGNVNSSQTGVDPSNKPHPQVEHSLVEKTSTVKSPDQSAPEKRLQEEMQTHQELQAEIQSLRIRLSEVAAKNLVAGNANIADLSDPNRPTKLADKYSELYDNLWSDAFEELSKQSQFKNKEEAIPRHLLDIIKVVNQFCRESKAAQLTLLQNAFQLPMLFPFYNLETAAKKKPKKSDKDVEDILESALPILAAAQRTTCQISLAELKREFLAKKMKSIQLNVSKLPKVSEYLNNCLELLWIMHMQDPPMHLIGFNESDLSPTTFREYTERGSLAVSCVWPALFLFQGGPLMKKGVAVFK